MSSFIYIQPDCVLTFIIASRARNQPAPFVIKDDNWIRNQAYDNKGQLNAVSEPAYRPAACPKVSTRSFLLCSCKCQFWSQALTNRQ
eukprot:5735232-Amphidinium_carterae.3